MGQTAIVLECSPPNSYMRVRVFPVAQVTVAEPRLRFSPDCCDVSSMVSKGANAQAEGGRMTEKLVNQGRGNRSYPSWGLRSAGVLLLLAISCAPARPQCTAYVPTHKSNS